MSNGDNRAGSRDRAIAIMAGGAPVESAEVGAFIVTPGQILSEMNSLLSAVGSFSEEVARQFYAPRRDEVALKLIAQQKAKGAPLTAEEIESTRASFGLSPEDPTTLHPQFVRAYYAWANNVQGWYRIHHGFLARTWGGVYEKANQLKAELNDWRAKFRELGGKTESPDLKFEKPTDFVGVMKTVGIVAAVALTGGILYKVVSK